MLDIIGTIVNSIGDFFTEALKLVTGSIAGE